MRFNHAENFLSASLAGAFFYSLSRAARDGEGGKGADGGGAGGGASRAVLTVAEPRLEVGGGDMERGGGMVRGGAWRGASLGRAAGLGLGAA